MKTDLVNSRRRTTQKLQGVEYPECFRDASFAAEARLLAVAPQSRTIAQSRDLARTYRKCSKLEK